MFKSCLSLLTSCC